MRDIATLVGLEVVSSSEGKSLGTIDEVLVDLAAGKLLGVVVGRGPAEKGIRAADLQALGTDAVLVSTAEVAVHLSAMPDLLEYRQRSEQGRPEVITSDGRRMGTLAAVYINPQTKELTRFEVSGGRWRDLTDGITSLPVFAGIIHGPDVVIVPAEALDRPKAKGGLKASLRQLGGATQVGYERATRGAERLYEEGSDALRDGLTSARQQVGRVAKEMKQDRPAGDADEESEDPAART